MNDPEIVFNRLVGAFCGPLVVVRQFPNALNKLKECVNLTGLEIVRSISSSNDRAKYVYFQDYNKILALIEYELEYHLLDSLKRNNVEVGKMIENNLEESYVTYPIWFREWCATLAMVLRIERNKKFKIPLERNGIFIFCNKYDDLSIMNTIFEDYKEFPVALVYLFDRNDNNVEGDNDKEGDNKEKDNFNQQLLLEENENKQNKQTKDQDKDQDELVLPDYSDKFEQMERSNESVVELEQPSDNKQENEFDDIKYLKEKKEREMNNKIDQELLKLIKTYDVKYYVIDTNEDFCNSSELVKFVDDFVYFCTKKIKYNVEFVNSSLKGLKLSSKLLKSPDIDRLMSKLVVLLCDELFMAQDTLMVNIIKSNIEHEIQALSQFIYGVYLYRYKKHQPKTETRNDGEWVSEEDGKIFIDSYTSISHFDKSISLFNKYSYIWESFFISLLSSLLGDYEEINKLLSKNSLLELITENDYGRSALCLELSSNRCDKMKKKKFQLMMAGRLYNQASLDNLSKMCYLSCLNDYEEWDIANEHLYSLLGDFDNNYLVNCLNVLSNNYENKYSRLRSFEDIDNENNEDNDKDNKEIENNSEKEVYYLKKLMKLNGFQMGTKYLVSTPISGTFENYPTIYYRHHPLPLVEGEIPFLVRIPILYLRKNGIIGTNVKLTTSYADDLYEKLFENSFKDNTWHKCIKFDSIKDHVKKDFFTVNQASRGANYMIDTKLNLSLQLLNPLNITVDCYKFNILVKKVNIKPATNKYNINKDNSNDNNNKDNEGREDINNTDNTNNYYVDPDLKWVECDIISDEDSGFQLKEFEKKNLLLTFRAQEVGSFKIVGLCWKLFDRVHFWSPLYTVGNKLKNYEFTKKISLNEFMKQRAIDKTLYFNVYEDRPKINYYFKKVSNLKELQNCVYFVKKDFEFINYDNLLRYYSEKYSDMTKNLDENKAVDENENLCLFDFFNGESSLIKLSIRNLQDLPLSSLTLRFKVLGNFKIYPYPVGYKVYTNKRTVYEDNRDQKDSNKEDRREEFKDKQQDNKDTYKTKEEKQNHEYNTNIIESLIDCTWNVINLPNVKVRDESLNEKMYELFMKFKDENFTLYNYSLSIYFYLESMYFLDGIALIDGLFGVVPQTGLDLLVPFKLFLKIKKGPTFKSYYDYKEIVKVQVYNRSREEINQLDFIVNDKHVESTDNNSNNLLDTLSEPYFDTLYSKKLQELFDTTCKTTSSNTILTSKESPYSTSIPSKSTMNYILPIEDPISLLTNTQVSHSERMPISIFWSTSERFGVFNGYVEFIEYKLLVKVAASPKIFKSSGNPAVVDLLLTLQNLSSEVVNSLSVSPLQDYESESLISYIGETRKGVKSIDPGSSVSLFYQIVLPLPGIYHFSPLSFKLDTNIDEKNVNYQDNINTVIVYD